jgi:hypothetical protein
MKDGFPMGFGIGLLVIAIGVAAVFYMQRGAHIQVTGRILKVRVAPLDEHSSVAVVDFRVTNPADYAFVVRTVTLVLEDPAGKQTEGTTVSETDTERLFAGVPLLGQKYNSSLIARDTLAPHQTMDRMVAARFEVPESELELRKRLVVRVDEVDGAVSEINEIK